MSPDRTIALVAESQHGLVTREQARTAGLSDDAIEGRLRTGLWERVHRSVYRLAGTPLSPKQAVMGSCLAGGAGAVASHHTAAGLWGLPVSGRCLEITVVRPRRVHLAGVVVHQTGRLPRVDAVWRDRIPLTSVARTLVDLSGTLRPDRLESALDHALAERQVSLGYLRWRLEDLRTQGRVGGVLADFVASRFGEPLPSRSPFERELQRLLARANLPPAGREYAVALPRGRMARIDFAFLTPLARPPKGAVADVASLGRPPRPRSGQLPAPLQPERLVPGPGAQQRAGRPRMAGSPGHVPRNEAGSRRRGGPDRPRPRTCEDSPSLRRVTFAGSGHAPWQGVSAPRGTPSGPRRGPGRPGP